MANSLTTCLRRAFHYTLVRLLSAFFDQAGTWISPFRPRLQVSKFNDLGFSEPMKEFYLKEKVLYV